MSDLERGRKLALNPNIINKHAGGDARFFAYGWVNEEVSIPALILAIQKGWAFTTQHKSPRRSDNFDAADLACVDIDDGLRLEEVLDHPLVREHGLFVYTTFNHTSDKHRIRAVFDLSRTVTKGKEIRAITRALTRRLQGDATTIDPTRICFGNTNAEVHVIGRQVTPELLDELIADGSGRAKPGLGSRPAETTRSVLTLRAGEPLRLSDGSTACLANLPRGTRLHCPYHDDRNASAFVTQSQRGTKGVVCSACAKTFWPADAEDDYDFGDFEKALRRAQEAQRQGKAHTEGLVPGSLAERILMGPDTRIVSGQATPSFIRPGLTLIKSPKGSGKTEGLVEFLRDKRKVLVVGHRRSLLAEVSRRLGISYYLDDPDRADGDASQLHPPIIDDGADDDGPWPGGEFFYAVLQTQERSTRVRAFDKDRLAVCADSLMQVGTDASFDAIVIDECEQVFDHFLSDTMGRLDGPGPHRILTLLASIMRKATWIVGLDADLGWSSFATFLDLMERRADLSARPAEVVRVWLNEAQPTRQEIELHASKEHLIGEMKQAMLDGQRVFGTTNSLALVETLEAAVREIAPGKRIIAITSKTISTPEVKRFLANAKVHALEYDLILGSPAVGTGIDLTFPGNAKLIDTVFGFFEPMVITHMQIDQQLGRVRHPGSVKVWVSPQTFRFETNHAVVLEDLRRLGRCHDLLIDFDERGREVYAEDTPLIRMAARIVAEERASKNNLRSNFIKHKEAQGCSIVHVDKDIGAAAIGSGLVRIGTQIREEAYAQRILQAKVLTRPMFERVKKKLERGDAVAEEVSWDYQRTGIELFYREHASVELIRSDQRGRRRGQVILLRSATQQLADLDRLLQDPLQPLPGNLRFMRSSGSPAYVIARLLRLTPFYAIMARDGSSGGSVGEALLRCDPATGRPLFRGGVNFEAVADARDLSAFVGFVRANKPGLETQLGMPIRSDLDQKPIQQLGAVLKMLGLPLVQEKKIKVSGETIRRYQIDPAEHEAMRRVVATREGVRGWRFMVGQYGPEMDPCCDDDWDETET